MVLFQNNLSEEVKSGLQTGFLALIGQHPPQFSLPRDIMSNTIEDDQFHHMQRQHQLSLNDKNVLGIQPYLELFENPQDLNEKDSMMLNDLSQEQDMIHPDSTDRNSKTRKQKGPGRSISLSTQDLLLLSDFIPFSELLSILLKGNQEFKSIENYQGEPIMDLKEIEEIMTKLGQNDFYLQSEVRKLKSFDIESS